MEAYTEESMLPMDSACRMRMILFGWRRMNRAARATSSLYGAGDTVHVATQSAGDTVHVATQSAGDTVHVATQSAGDSL